MKIVYVPSDMDAPGCYRSLFPARHLREKGHIVQMPPYDQWQEEDGRWRTNFKIALNPPEPWGDLYVIQQPKSRMWREEGIGLARRWGMCTVMDVDDNYLELPSYNPSFLGSHPYRRDDGVILNRKKRRELAKKVGYKVPPNEHNREHMHAVMQGVDAVTVSTPYLAEIYERLNPNIHVIRNYLEWDIWEGVVPQYEVERERIRVGYLAAFGYRHDDLNVIRAVISKFVKRHPEVDFVFSSKINPETGEETFPMHDFFRIPEDQRIGVPEYGFYPGPEGVYPVGEKTACVDIGLVPLALNGLNEGKSHLKGMEYNAAGIPFIASPTESYRDYWCDESNGFIARTEKEWLEILETLVADEKLRRMMGKHGREKARDHSLDRKIHLWENTYEMILGGEEEKITRASIAIGAVQKVSECSAMLKRLREIKPKCVVEIGSAAGGTFWAMAQFADPKAMLVSIDLVAGSPIDQRRGKDVYANRDRDRMRTYGQEGQKIRLIDGNSQETETMMLLKACMADEGHEAIDFLFIDGDHRYPGVRRDYELYAPLVRPGGLIAFHDITIQNDPRSMVHVFWPELRDRLPEGSWEEYIGHDNWGVGQWGGIGVMVRPLELPELPDHTHPKVKPQTLSKAQRTVLVRR